MKKIAILLIAVSIFVSCEKNENLQFDNENGQTLAFFEVESSNLPVVIDDSGSVDVRIGVTTISTSARTINVSVVDDETTALPDTYSLASSTVTIPANEYFGVLTINGVDNNVDTAAKLITLKLEGISGGIVDPTLHVVSIFEVCPIPSGAFLGNYAMEQLTVINPADGVQVFENQILAITIPEDGAETSRQFEAIYLEALNIGQPATTVTFSLVCNNIIVDSGIETRLVCAAGEPVITLGPGDVPSNYDATDDSVFELTLTEYETGGDACSASPYQVTFRLTKQ